MDAIFMEMVNSVISTAGFREYFYGQLDIIFPDGWRYQDTATHNEVGYIAVEGSTGWSQALEATMKHFKLTKEWDYYKQLPWDQSDDFDWQLEKAFDHRDPYGFS